MIFRERAMGKGPVKKMFPSASLIISQPQLQLYMLLCGNVWPRKKIWALKFNRFLHNGKLSLHMQYQELFIFLGEEHSNECLCTRTAWNPVWKHRHARGWLCWPKRWPKVTSTDPLFYQAPIVNWNWREISVAWQKKKKKKKKWKQLEVGVNRSRKDTHTLTHLHTHTVAWGPKYFCIGAALAHKEGKPSVWLLMFVIV